MSSRLPAEPAGEHAPVLQAEVVPLSARAVPDLLAEFEATGRQEPYEEIVRRYAGMVYNVCYGVTKDAHDAEDATQAVFLTLAVRSKTAQKIQYLGPWLQRVAQRLSLDMKRSKKRRGARELKHHDLNVGRWESNAQPHDLGMDELRGILRDEIDRLPPKYRMPLILHYFGGLKPEELSKELGIKANTLGVRLHRARKMLGENLAARGIVVGGAMLSAALAALIPVYVQHAVSGNATAAAASYAVGHQLVAAEVSARVLGMLRASSRASILANVKAIAAVAALGAAAAAGGAELIRQAKLHGFDLRDGLELKRWIAPIFDRFRLPIRLVAGAEADPVRRVYAAAERAPTPRFDGPTFVVPQTAGASAWFVDDDAPILASPRHTGFDRIELERTPFAIPVTPAQQAAVAAQRAAVASVAPALPQAPGHRAVPATGQPSQAAPFRVAPVAPLNAALAPRSMNDAFARAAGSFRQADGLLDAPRITIDSGSASVRSFHLSGGSVNAERLTVAEAGEAEFIQSGGQVTADTLTIARDEGSRGRYELSGGEVRAVELSVGHAGRGELRQSGGTVVAPALSLGTAPTGDGFFAIRNGQVFANDLRVGIAGTGAFVQTGGSTHGRSTQPGGGVRIAEQVGSRGAVSVSGGTFQADQVYVGLNGEARYTLSGGQTIADRLVLGADDQATAALRATDGVVYFGGAATGAALDPRLVDLSTRAQKWQKIDYVRSASGAWTLATSAASGNAFVVGAAGDAVVELGSATRTATLAEASNASSTPVLVRATPSARGVVRGYGHVDLRGPLVQNGKLIADGLGRSRVLDFSSVAGVQNTIDNDIDGAFGYYAQRGGELRLPSVRVRDDGDYNWGEAPGDPVPDLVNSVRVGFDGVSHSGDMRLSLLAPDRAERDTGIAAPEGELFVSLWRFDRVGLVNDSTDLLVRYDEQAVEHLGLPESALSFWSFDGAWQKLSPAELVLDERRNLIGGTIDGRFEYFAVSLSAGALAMLESDPFGGGMLVPGLVAGGTLADPDRIAAFIDRDRLVASSPAASSGVVPEPGGVAVLAAAVAMLGRRRRRVAPGRDR